MLRLHLLPETPAEGATYACAAIRLLNPWRHPSLAAQVKVTTGQRLPAGRIDAIITQRGGPPDATLAEVQGLVRDARLRRIPLICDLDDDLLTEHTSLAVEAQLAAYNIRPRVRFLLREADAVIVSTPVLAARLVRLNPAIHVWPNALDERLALPLPAGEGADMGYFGTLSHLEDLLPVIGPLEAALARRPGRSRVEFCGIADDARIGQFFAGVADVALLPVDGDYPSFMRARQRQAPWAAGIAPLADTAFNRGKSDIKFLDYALFGAPGIYADLPVYAEVRDGETGLKAAPGEFGTALLRLLEDPPLRHRIRTQARDWVLQERVLARRAPELLTILRRVLDRAPGEVAA